MESYSCCLMKIQTLVIYQRVLRHISASCLINEHFKNLNCTQLPVCILVGQLARDNGYGLHSALKKGRQVDNFVYSVETSNMSIIGGIFVHVIVLIKHISTFRKEKQPDFFYENVLPLTHCAFPGCALEHNLLKEVHCAQHSTAAANA